MGETSAPLLAQWVAMACNQVLADIIERRERTLADIVESKIGTAMYAGKSREDIYRDLPEEERMIPMMHRVDDENRLRKIFELADLVADVPDLRMDVSIDDFQLIKKPYKFLAGKG